MYKSWFPWMAIDPLKYEAGRSQWKTIDTGLSIGGVVMTNARMKKLMSLWNVLALMAVEGNSLEIKMDPGMREGFPSYLYCDIGTVAAGVSFFKEPAIVKGNCLAPGEACSSTLYTLTQNTTGVLLEIASVDASREEGEWYCQHDTERSTNTISLNDLTIVGVLLTHDWTKPPGPVNTFSAVMTLSCAYQVPDFNFTFKDSESNTGIVPPEAESTTTQPSFDGTNCGNGKRIYVITLTASNKLEVFNNKKDVTFTFTYYGTSIDAAFTVDFLEFDKGTSGELRDWEIVIIVVVVVLVILAVVIIICCLKNKRKCCFKEKGDKQATEGNSTSDTTANNGVVNSANGTQPPMNMTSK